MAELDPLSREAALLRITEAGKRSGLWGAPATCNPYWLKHSMQREAAAWLLGHSEGLKEWEAKDASRS